MKNLIFTAVIAFCPIVGQASEITDSDWEVINDKGILGTSNTINSVVYNGGSLYLTGFFEHAGSVQSNRLARWDGESWHAYPQARVRHASCMTADQKGNVYIAGRDSLYKIYVEKWDGSTWDTLGLLDQDAHAMHCDSEGNLFVVGAFTSIDSVGYSHIARWDGESWDSLGAGTNGHIRCITGGMDNVIYIGGDFDRAGSKNAKRIARWDGDSWDSIPNVSGYPVINSLACDGNGNLYAGGDFRTMGTNVVYSIARWDGEEWHSLGKGVRGRRYSTDEPVVNNIICDPSGNLYVNGEFENAGEIRAINIAMWDGTEWKPLGGGTSSKDASLACDDDGNLYLADFFSSIDSFSVGNIAKWDGTKWGGVGEGINGIVAAVTEDENGDIILGGEFTFIGGVEANHVVRMNEMGFEALGEGVNGSVTALVSDGKGNVYAGGNFTRAGQTDASHIARWDGQSWSSLGQGVNGNVKTLVIDEDDNLFVGGSFDSAGGVIARRVAKWDGSRWSTLGTGMNNQVNALCLDNAGNLYAGGYFIVADGDFANHIARWDGNIWTQVGENGLEDVVTSLSIESGGNLYAAYGNTSSTITKWDGEEWKSEISFSGKVLSMVFDDKQTLYMGGSFRMERNRSGADTLNNIATWDGGAVSKLGSGVDNTIRALHLSESGLYTGGEFFEAGGKASPCIARVKTDNALPVTHSKGSHSAQKLITYRIAGHFLSFSNLQPKDRICLFDVSGRLIRSATGVSPLSLAGLSSQPVIIRVTRNRTLLHCGIVVIQ